MSSARFLGTRREQRAVERGHRRVAAQMRGLHRQQHEETVRRVNSSCANLPSFILLIAQIPKSRPCQSAPRRPRRRRPLSRLPQLWLGRGRRGLREAEDGTRESGRFGQAEERQAKVQEVKNHPCQIRGPNRAKYHRYHPANKRQKHCVRIRSLHIPRTHEINRTFKSQPFRRGRRRLHRRRVDRIRALPPFAIVRRVTRVRSPDRTLGLGAAKHYYSVSILVFLVDSLWFCPTCSSKPLNRRPFDYVINYNRFFHSLQFNRIHTSQNSGVGTNYYYYHRGSIMASKLLHCS